jgi:hypothetical protein
MRTEEVSSTAVRKAIEALRHMTVGQLKDKYRDVFGESSRSNHKQFLFRRIAWRMQANAWGGLSERARRRALEIANDADLRIRAPKNFLKVELDESRAIETRVAPTEDPRLPKPGSMLVRRYRGKDIVVRVREDGFEYDGQVHRSLSSAVRGATGTPWNGFAFFGLGGKPGRAASSSVLAIHIWRFHQAARALRFGRADHCRRTYPVWNSGTAQLNCTTMRATLP